MSDLYCRHCGASFKQQAIFALLFDLGCRGSDPVYCHSSSDEKHDFIKEPKPPTADPD